MTDDKEIEDPWFLKSGPRLFGILFITLAIPLAILAFFLISQIRHATNEGLITQNNISGRLIAHAVGERISGIIDLVESFARRSTLVKALEDQNIEGLEEILSDLKQMKREFTSIEVVDLRGKILDRVPKLRKDQPDDHSDQEWFQHLSTRGKRISSVHKNLHNPTENVITISSPILNDKKEPIGFLVGHYPVYNISRTLYWLKVSTIGSFYIIDDKGTVISQQVPGTPSLISRENLSFFYNLLKGQTQKTEGITETNNLPSLISYHPVGKTGWTVIASQQTTKISDFLKSLYLPIFGMVLISLLVMFSFGSLWLNAIRKYHIQQKAIQKDLLMKSEEASRFRVDLDQLKSFAFITSHDLQEPIHHLHRLGEKLQNETQGKLDSQSQGYITQILDSTATMGHLADQLRDFSKSDTESIVFETVDLNEVVKKVLNEFKDEISKTAAVIEVGKLPTVKADRKQMETVIRNIVDNAFTFKRENIAPNIKFSSIPLSRGFVEILIQDNGIGFEEKHVEEIFRPFHRLHAGSEYPGSGLGLAISRRIILRHGGIISARSKPEKGTTIVIMLPS